MCFSLKVYLKSEAYVGILAERFDRLGYELLRVQHTHSGHCSSSL